MTDLGLFHPVSVKLKKGRHKTVGAVKKTYFFKALPLENPKDASGVAYIVPGDESPYGIRDF
jgi:hypothetical protein